MFLKIYELIYLRLQLDCNVQESTSLSDKCFCNLINIHFLNLQFRPKINDI